MVTKLLTLNGEDQLCLPDSAVLTVARVMHSLQCTAHAHAQISVLKARRQEHDFSFHKPGCKERAKLVCQWQAVTLFHVQSNGCIATKFTDTHFSYKSQFAYAHKLHVKAATCDTPCWTGHIQASSTQDPITGGQGTGLFLPASRGQTNSKCCRKTEHLRRGQRRGAFTMDKGARLGQN